MGKERLKEIEGNSVTNKLHDFITEIPYEDFKWLVSTVEEQANKIESFQNLKEILEEANHGMAAKVEEQQKEIEFLNKAHQTNIKIAEYAQEENTRLHEALRRAVKIMQDYAFGDVQAEVDMMYFVEEWRGKIDG